MIRIPQLFSIVLIVAVVSQLNSFCTAQEPGRWIGGIVTYGDESGMVIAETVKPNVYVAYSKLTGEWTSYSFPPNLSVTPITGGLNAVGFRIVGKDVKKLVAVDRFGKWHEQDLSASIDLDSDSLYLAVTKNIAVYQVAKTTYAFSGLTGKWDVIANAIKPKVSSDVAMIVAADRIKVFSAHTSKWSESPELATTK